MIFIRYGGPFTTEGSTLESIGVDGQGLAPVAIGSLVLAPFTLSFSPDGQQIAIALNGGDLYTLSTTGSSLVKLADGPISEVTWSPLGPTLFFSKRSVSAAPPCTQSRIYRLDVSQAAAPVPITDGACDDTSPTWTAVSLALPPLGNLLPPVITPPKLVNQLLGGLPSLVPPAAGASARSASRRPPHDRLPFLVTDPVGIRHLGAAVAQRASDRRCRFVVGTRLAADTSCGRRRYFDVRTDTDWRRRTQWLPRGRYQIWFRATDTAGRRSKKHLSAAI